METILSEVGEWMWWIVAAILSIVELIVPGIFFVWLAAAAAIVGVLVLVFPIPLMAQIALFAVLSVIAVWISRRWFKRHPIESDAPLLNQRVRSYIGHSFTLEQAIVNGRGKLKIGDSQWLASGPDLPVGAKVRVTGEADGVLIVEAIG
ncbi:MAG: NfeD family protein [Parvibaculum sp.]|nr:NfeD family protein [Parvibaculum sp.]|tara:strand:- start:98 stop:544 length:447 start_codon:yes stop_codon:yes gene_type:complete